MFPKSETKDQLHGLRLLTEGEVAALCKIAVPTLQAARQRRGPEGPPFVKLGRTVRYRLVDVELFLAQHTVGSLPAADVAQGFGPLDIAFIRGLVPLAKEVAEALEAPPPSWRSLSDAGKLLDLMGLLAERVLILAEGLDG